VKRPVYLALVVALLLAGCERERRELRHEPSTASTGDTGIEQSPLHPGEASVLKPGESQSPVNNEPGPYSYNANAVSEGQRLFDAYNCSGCHAHGGGGIGPPLMTGTWTYGGQPQNIHDTIVEGRPNGMPSWRHRIPDYQVWEIVAYVRSMSGQLPPTVAPARSDTMNYKKPEQVTPGQGPQQR